MQGHEQLSLVGRSVRITGEIYCGQDLIVEGEVDGTVKLPEHKLTIGPEATVKATIQAQAVVVVGAAEGTIEAQRVELCNHSHLLGDIKTPRIAIQDGAHFQGTIEVTRPAVTPECS